MKITRSAALLTGAVALAVSAAVPASATSAGQYCKKADAGVVKTADNGDTVRCDYDSTDGRHHWVAISADDDASVPAADASEGAAPAEENLAETGGDGRTPYLVGAGALMLVGGGYLTLRRRTRTR